MESGNEAGKDSQKVAHLVGESIRGCVAACAAEHTQARSWVWALLGHRPARKTCESTAHTIQHPIKAVLILKEQWCLES